jgi:hypothetical protein
MHLEQLTPLPFTPYVRQCLVDIGEAKDHDLDEVLVHFVRVQYLAERVAVLKRPQLKGAEPRNDTVTLENGEQDQKSQERAAALAGCQAYLDRLVDELPRGLRDNGKPAYLPRVYP